MKIQKNHVIQEIFPKNQNNIQKDHVNKEICPKDQQNLQQDISTDRPSI